MQDDCRQTHKPIKWYIGIVKRSLRVVGTEDLGYDRTQKVKEDQIDQTVPKR